LSKIEADIQDVGSDRSVGTGGTAVRVVAQHILREEAVKPVSYAAPSSLLLIRVVLLHIFLIS
jgi:hypothetical protein